MSWGPVGTISALHTCLEGYLLTQFAIQGNLAIQFVVLGGISNLLLDWDATNVI